MKALNDQEELEKLGKLAKQNVQEELDKRAKLARLAKLAQMKKTLCKLQAVLSEELKQKAGLAQNKENLHDPLKSIKKEVSSIGFKTANASKNLNILNLESQISVSIAMDYTEPKPSLAQLEKLSKLQEEMSKRYLENQISVEKRPIVENTTAIKDKWKKGHPITEINNPLPSTSSDITQRLMLLSGTIQQIKPKPLLLESPELPGSNSERSTEPKG
jgi:hypothetical protein